MPSDPASFALRTPGLLSFPSSRLIAERFEQIGGRAVASPTGHLVFYRPDGRRFLATDPAGHPLHECEWGEPAEGGITLVRARLRLDCGRWVGLKPNGLVHETTLNLATKPGWRRVTPDTLRGMAAQALRMPSDAVGWFFRDEDLSIDGTGVATIRHRKDALYVLGGEGFEHPQFMSCMGAMHWDHIDFLPVVELFKSLLPGTGSAVFELIRGLYDDQNKAAAIPRTLRYRGLPTYPSEAAFRLFSSFFTPEAPDGGDPLTCFMDPLKADHVIWRPASGSPVRYYDERRGLCLTVQGGVAQKATLADDPAGAPYVNPDGRRIVPLDRSLRVNGTQLVLRDRTDARALDTTIPLTEIAGPSVEAPVSPLDWRHVLGDGYPSVRPAEAYTAVLLYPEDDSEIGELSAQPFVADYLQDLAEQDREIGQVLSKAKLVLIDNGDAVLATCIAFDRPRGYTVRTRHAAHAQRQAQQLWSLAAESQQWERLRQVRFVHAAPGEDASAPGGPYDLVYQWLPYDCFDEPAALVLSATRLSEVLQRGGAAFIVGPADLEAFLLRRELQVSWQTPVETLPTFCMHRTILPLARVKAGLTLFLVRKS